MAARRRCNAARRRLTAAAAHSLRGMPRLFALFVLALSAPAPRRGGLRFHPDVESGGGSDEAPASLPQGGVDDVRVQGADDLTAKPAVKIPDRPPARRLQQADLVVGKGRAARKGDQLSVQYVGLAGNTAEQFDASWDSGAKPFDLEPRRRQRDPGLGRGRGGDARRRRTTSRT